MTKSVAILLTGVAMVALPQNGAAPAAAASPLSPAEAAMRAHVAYLASDELGGREPASPYYDKATAYVVQQMKAAGLRPAGEAGGWYQKVPLLVTRAIGKPGMSFGGKPLDFNSDFTVWPTAGLPGLDLDAPIVFVGHGVVDSVTGRDDYRGLDVRGKIVAFFVTGPKDANSDVAAHLGNFEDRAKVAQARGAIGFLLLPSKQLEMIWPFPRFVETWQERQLAWSAADGRRNLGVPRIGVLSDAGAAKLFAGRPTNWDAIRADENAGKPLPLGLLDGRLSTRQAYETARQQSVNVLGRLPGSDPRLNRQTVVVSAHLDHVGIVHTDKGDQINHGALDNAMGVASILEMAKLFKANHDKTRRSILFLAPTGEEKGLIGSDYFVRHPTVPVADIVADVNIDMPILTYRFEDLIATGAERSSIGPIVKSIAVAEGLELTPDPMPEQAAFTRSDHYSFVRIGVPSLFLKPGLKGPGLAATNDARRRYHHPSDDMSQPFDWAAGREFVKINYLIAKRLADATDRPQWVSGDYFGALYKGAAKGR